MGKKIVLGLATALFAVMLCACSGSADTKTEHRIFQSASNGQYAEYTVVSYGDKTHKLMGVSDQMAFFKSAGYELSDFEGVTIDDVYPGASTLKSSSLTITEDDEAVYINVSFKNLDKKENFLGLYDIGLLTTTSNTDPSKYDFVDADSTCTSLKTNGQKEVTDSSIPSWIKLDA